LMLFGSQEITGDSTQGKSAVAFPKTPSKKLRLRKRQVDITVTADLVRLYTDQDLNFRNLHKRRKTKCFDK
jgi:hypothetical protein